MVSESEQLKEKKCETQLWSVSIDSQNYLTVCFALDDGRAEWCRFKEVTLEEEKCFHFHFILNHKLLSMFWTLFNRVKDEQNF